MKPRKKIVEKALNFDKPERIPRHAWILPWAEHYHPETVLEIKQRFPDDIVNAPALYQKELPLVGGKYILGTYIDEWGCKFRNIHEGVIGIIEEPRIKTWDDLNGFKTPEETLHLDVDAINSFCRSTDQFVLSGNIPRPFERFQFLRSMEQSLMDLMMQDPELKVLLDMLHDHYCKEIEVWAKTDVDGIAFMDDWGTQQALMASPDIFREFFKPMYKDFAEIARSYGKYIFMHSDGYITDIIEDLIEVGINALNSQVFIMDVKHLGERFKGRITFWGEIDRQDILPNGTLEDIDNAVRLVYDNLYDRGGVIAQCEFGPGAKPANVVRVFEKWAELGN